MPYTISERRVTFRLGHVHAGGETRLAFQLDLPRGEPGPKRFGIATVSYDDVAHPGEPVRLEFPLEGTYTESMRDAARASDERVHRAVYVLSLLDSMLLAKKSGDPSAIRQVLSHIASAIPRLRSRAERSDDREARDLLMVFEHCAEILQEELEDPSGEGLEGARDLAKEISYKLYRLRYHHPWRDDGR